MFIENTYKNIGSNAVIHNGPTLEATQIPINSKKDK